MSQPYKLEREGDGVTHINVWSKAKTELGQLLSNFTYSPFTHPQHGTFASMEAYWYWLATGKTHNELRRMYDASAKGYGKKLERVAMPDDEFKECIRQGLKAKIEQNATLKKAFINSTLPFEHYFVYGQKTDVIVDQRAKHGWQTDYLEELRDELRQRYHLPPLHAPKPVVDDSIAETLPEKFERWLLAAYRYYVTFDSDMADYDWDMLGRELKENWDKFNHPDKGLIDVESINTAYYVKWPEWVKERANGL